MELTLGVVLTPLHMMGDWGGKIDKSLEADGIIVCNEMQLELQ